MRMELNLPEGNEQDIKTPEIKAKDARLVSAILRPEVILSLILFLALFLRVTHWLAVRNDPFIAQLIMDSQEYDRWAREIASGNWLGKEAFFQAPLYPYFLAVIYKIFGRSLDAVYLIQIVLSVLGIFALYKAGEVLGGKRLGLAAAFLAALYGVFVFYDVQVQKESLAVTVVCFLLWLIIRSRQQPKVLSWLFIGILSGLLSLLRENALLVLPFFLLLTYQKGAPARLFSKRCGLFLAGLGLVLLPVGARNWKLGGSFLPTTFQGGVNFYIGNNPQASGTYQPIVPGKQMPYYEREEPTRIAELESGRKLSPAEVSNFWLRKSWAWIRSHPADFFRLQLKKISMYFSWYEWPDAVDYYYIKETSPMLSLPLLEFSSISLLALLGLIHLRRRLWDWIPVWLFVLAWTISTVIFFLFSRYRLPSVPGLMLLGAVPLCLLYGALREKRTAKAGILLFCVVAAFSFSWVIKHKPRMDLVYYNLALVEEEQEHADRALTYYRKAIAANPDDFLFYNNIGNLFARKNDWAKALEWYKNAEAKEPSSEGVQSNLGMAYAILGRLEEAEAHYDRALKINPFNIEALHNKSLLLAQKGRIREALELNQKVLELAPGWQPAIKIKQKLEEIMKAEKK